MVLAKVSGQKRYAVRLVVTGRERVNKQRFAQVMYAYIHAHMDTHTCIYMYMHMYTMSSCTHAIRKAHQYEVDVQFKRRSETKKYQTIFANCYYDGSVTVATSPSNECDGSDSRKTCDLVTKPVNEYR